MKTIIHTESRRHLRSNCYPGGTDGAAIAVIGDMDLLLKLTVPNGRLFLCCVIK
jgi:hypothetical protein